MHGHREAYIVKHKICLTQYKHIHNPLNFDKGWWDCWMTMEPMKLGEQHWNLTEINPVEWAPSEYNWCTLLNTNRNTTTIWHHWAATPLDDTCRPPAKVETNSSLVTWVTGLPSDCITDYMLDWLTGWQVTWLACALPSYLVDLLAARCLTTLINLFNTIQTPYHIACQNINVLQRLPYCIQKHA